MPAIVTKDDGEAVKISKGGQESRVTETDEVNPHSFLQQSYSSPSASFAASRLRMRPTRCLAR